MWVDNLTLEQISAVSDANDEIEKSLRDYKSKLQEIVDKKNAWNDLNEQDRQTISDAKKFAETINSKNEEAGTIKTQSRELRELLSKFSDTKREIIFNSQKEKEELKWILLTDETKAVISYLGLKTEDVKDINFTSALNLIISWKSWTDYNSWKEVWYKADWFFWASELEQLNNLSLKIDQDRLSKYIDLKNNQIKLIDVANTKLILNTVSFNEVYKVLFDINNDLEVSLNDNQNVIRFKETYELVQNLINSWKEQQVLKSISNILWLTLSSREDLFNNLKDNPENKYKILKNITLLAWAWNSKSTYVSDLLEHWKEATKVSLERKSKVDRYINEIFDKEKIKLDEKYNTAISEFEKNIPADKKEQYKDIVALLKSSEAKKTFFENIKLNWVWILASLVEWKRWIWAWVSFSNRELDVYLKEKTKSIISWVNLDLWFASIWGQVVPWIWASIDLSHDISEETRAFGKIWIINLIPYAMGGVETQLNLDEIKQMWFVDLTKKAEYAGASVNVSSLGWWAALHYRKDQLKWIEQKEKQFSEFLNSALNTDKWVDMPYITSMPDYRENKTYYDTFAKNISDILNSQNFDSLPTDYKKAIISSIKTSSTFVWRENMLKAAEQNGYEFSGIWIGVQFLAWFMPLPTFGIAWEKTSAWYRENQVSRLYAVLWEVLNVKKVKTQNEVQIDSLSLTENVFEKNKNLFRNFAQNHPRDWKALITWDNTFEQKVDLVVNMLKTDRNKNNPFFKQVSNEMIRLKSSSNENDRRKLNDLMAQFFDISFKDIRNIEEIILWVTVKQDWKYEWNYDFISSRISAISRFANSEWLSPEFSSNTSNLYREIAQDKKDALARFKKWQSTISEIAFEQKKDARLFWFVASYKIDGSWKSLWKAMVEIPAWQVTKVEWKEKNITNSTDIKYVLDNFEKSSYWQNTINQILKQIKDTNQEAFSWINNENVRTLLETWTLTLNWKTINLDRDFVYFLYGRCANESMWLRINKLSFSWTEVTFWEIWPDWVARLNANITNTPVWDKTTIWVWVIWWKEDNNWNNTWTRWQTSTPWVEETWGPWTWGWWWAPGSETWWRG